MKPKRNSKTLMSITHSKAKMFEYNVPIEYHLGLLEISCQSDKIQILRVDNARRKTNRF